MFCSPLDRDTVYQISSQSALCARTCNTNLNNYNRDSGVCVRTPNNNKNLYNYNRDSALCARTSDYNFCYECWMQKVLNKGILTI